MNETNIESVYENYKKSYREIVLMDCKGELEYEQYYLDIDDDGDMQWYPGWKAGCFTYERDEELRSMSEEEALDWVDGGLSAAYNEDFKVLERLFCTDV